MGTQKSTLEFPNKNEKSPVGSLHLANIPTENVGSLGVNCAPPGVPEAQGKYLRVDLGIAHKGVPTGNAVILPPTSGIHIHPEHLPQKSPALLGSIEGVSLVAPIT